MPDRPRFLGRREEDSYLSLVDQLELTSGFTCALLVGEPAARAEVAARLRERFPFLSAPPSWGLLPELETALPALTGRGVCWIEGHDINAWRPCLAALNEARDRLRGRVDALFLLSGPSSLAPLIQDYPDLASIFGTVVRLGQAPGAHLGDSMKFSYLHLSDLHFDASTRWERRAPLESLPRFLEEQGLKPELVLVSGDIAQSGKEAEYLQAEEFFHQLMERLGLEARRHLFLVPGNHDVDRARMGVADKRLLRGLMDDAARGAESFDSNELEELLQDPRSLAMLGERMESFYAFTGRLLGPAHAWDARRLFRSEVIELGDTAVGLLLLNSAWSAGTDQDEHRLLLGACNVRDAQAESTPVNLTIAMAHHPLELLAAADQAEVAGLLRGRVDFLLTGHRHEAEIATRQGPDGATVEIAAGATCVGGRWPLGFCVTSLDGARARIRFFGYSRNKGGFWFPDGSLYKGAPQGVWDFNLPAHLHGERSATEGISEAQRQEAQRTRYRAAAQIYHARVSFVGLSHRGQAPQKNDVGELFVPLVAGPRGAERQPSTLAEDTLAPGEIDTSALARELLRRGPSGKAARIVLLGDPGSGKTMLTRALCSWATGGMDFGDVPASQELVPLRVPFREYVADLALHGDHGLIDFLVRQAGSALEISRDEEFFKKLLEEGRALVLLDGLDEVHRPEQREETVRRVQCFAAAWERAPILVTSRIVGYDEAPLPGLGYQRIEEHSLPSVCQGQPESHYEFRHLELRPLSLQRVNRLVERWYQAREPSDRRLREQLVADLQGALAASAPISELARNPLLATLICVVHGHRARLPGKRVVLYEEVVDTLLDTWHTAKLGTESFRDLDAERQRRFLQRLALGMMEERREDKAGRRPGQEMKEPPGMAIGREELVRRLVAFARENSPDDDPRVLQKRMERWVAWLAARTGLLVEQRPGSFGFLHLTLQEYLAACELKALGGDLIEGIRARAEQSPWRETLRLLLGLHADEPRFIQALVEGFREEPGVRDRVLVDSLCEELDLPPREREELVRRVLRGKGDRAGALAPLVFAARLSPRHAGAICEIAAEELLSWKEEAGLDGELARVMPSLVRPVYLLQVADRLRRLTRDGESLYWLYKVIEAAPDRARGRELIACFFDHVPAQDHARALALMEPWWREIPAGSFMMGSPDEEAERSEREGPQHEVRILNPFRLLAVPVTEEMFACLDPRRSNRKPMLPATSVSWYAAWIFARWLGLRLPREAEWEYACRAGTTTRFWSGDSEEDLARVGWYSGNTKYKIFPIAQKPANPWGLHDMHGGVWEWTTDPFRPYTNAAETVDPLAEPAAVPGDDPGAADRVVRGGGWWDDPRWCRSACRVRWLSGNWDVFQGFRVLVPLVPSRH